MGAVRQARMLASDADRDRAVKILKDSFVAGRLALDEFAQRVEQAFTSRDFRELLALYDDLPAGLYDRLPMHPLDPRRPTGKRRSRSWLARHLPVATSTAWARNSAQRAKVRAMSCPASRAS